MSLIQLLLKVVSAKAVQKKLWLIAGATGNVYSVLVVEQPCNNTILEAMWEFVCPLQHFRHIGCGIHSSASLASVYRKYNSGTYLCTTTASQRGAAEQPDAGS